MRISACIVVFLLASFPVSGQPAQSYAVSTADLVPGDVYARVKNTSGSNLCVNAYGQDPFGEVINCCSTLVVPGQLYYSSVRDDFAARGLTVSTPNRLTLHLFATVPVAGTCDAGSIKPDQLRSGLFAALGPPLLGGGGVPFAQPSPSSTDLSSLAQYCGFIQTNASGFGQCNPFRAAPTGTALPLLPAMASVSAAPGKVLKGQSATLTFTLSGPAPAGGATIGWREAPGPMTDPAGGYLTIPGGQTAATVAVVPRDSITATASSSVIGEYYGSTAATSLTVSIPLPPPPPNRLGADSFVVGSGAGTGSVVLKASGSWTAQSNATFLHVVNASGTGNGVVRFQYDAFSGQGTRSGTITIAGLTLTLSQVGTDYVAVNALSTLAAGVVDPAGFGGVAVDPNGNVYITDSNRNAIRKWDGGTEQISDFVTTGLSMPFGAAAAASGDLYVSQLGTNISRISPSGQVTNLSSVWSSGIALDETSALFTDLEGGSVNRMDLTTGRISGVVSGLSFPTALAMDAAGNVYIADAPLVKKWNAATGQTETLAAAVGSAPLGVAVDGAGNVYFTDYQEKSLKKWSPLTSTVSVVVPNLTAPSGAAVDGLGNVFFLDGDAVKKLTIAFVGPSSFKEPGGSGSDAVNVQPPGTPLVADLKPSVDQVWLTLGRPSNGTVPFSMYPNTTQAARNGAVTVLRQSIPVSQDRCMYSVGNSNFNIAPGGASGTLNVSATNGCPWAPIPSQSWIQVTTRGSAVDFVVGPNVSGSARNGWVDIAGNRVPFTQSACSYAVSPTTFTFGLGGGAGTAQVVAPAGCPWTTIAGATWAYADPLSGSGTATVTITADPNTGDNRSTSVSAAGVSLRIDQASCSAVGPTTVTLPSSASDGDLIVSAGPTCNWAVDASALPAWAAVARTGGQGPAMLHYTATANAGTAQRNATIRVGGTPVLFSQRSCSHSVVAGQGRFLTQQAQTITFWAEAAAGCGYPAPTSDAPWIIPNSTQYYPDGSASFSFLVTANSSVPRSGVLSIAGQTFYESQMGSACGAGDARANIAMSSGPVYQEWNSNNQAQDLYLYNWGDIPVAEPVLVTQGLPYVGQYCWSEPYDNCYNVCVSRYMFGCSQWGSFCYRDWRTFCTVARTGVTSISMDWGVSTKAGSTACFGSPSDVFRLLPANTSLPAGMMLRGLIRFSGTPPGYTPIPLSGLPSR